MGTLYEQALALQEDLKLWRRHLHRIPEIGLKLPQTSAFIQERLREWGIPFTVSPENSHVTALMGEGDSCILLRADMDALPMQEESGLDFAAVNGNAHACGHDMHATMLLGAAKLLKDNEKALKGRVKLLFQAGEETFQGAATALAEGVLENPRVDAAFAMHMAAIAPVGVMAYGTNPMSAVYGFKILLKGKGTHGSTPEVGIDPINAGVHVYLGLQELIAREVPAGSEAVITIGRFSAGNVNNVIPEEAVLEGTMRTFDPEIRTRLMGRIEEIARQIAAAYRCHCELSVTSDCPATVNDKALMEQVLADIREIVPGIQLLDIYHAMGSEDFAFFTDRIPCCYLALGGKPEDYPPYAEHNPKVRYNEKALPIGAAVLAGVALAYGERQKTNL